jgi:hypothetical protein
MRPQREIISGGPFNLYQTSLLIEAQYRTLPRMVISGVISA